MLWLLFLIWKTLGFFAYQKDLAGYMVLQPNYRGHGSSEGEPGGAYDSNDYIIDVLNSVSISIRPWSVQ